MRSAAASRASRTRSGWWNQSITPKGDRSVLGFATGGPDDGVVCALRGGDVLGRELATRVCVGRGDESVDRVDEVGRLADGRVFGAGIDDLEHAPLVARAGRWRRAGLGGLGGGLHERIGL